MGNYDDLLGGLDDFNDDDLLLLDVDENDLGKPTAGSKKKDSSFCSAEEDSDAQDEWELPTDTRGPQKKKKRGAIAVIIIFAVILIAIVATAVSMKLNGGRLPWPGDNNQEKPQITETQTATPDEETQPAESITPVESETTSAEQVETAEPIEVTPKESPVESEADEVDLSGIALAELQSANFAPNLVGINSIGAPQADTTLGQMDSTAANALQKFIAAAREAGYDTFRSTAYQEVKGDTDYTDEQLEHATGLAVDLVDNGHWTLSDMKEDTSIAEEIQWWADHAAEYGFILRYPEGKEDKTGVEYLPYHFTYVGTTIAQEMSENNWCLEEYLDRDNTGTTTG